MANENLGAARKAKFDEFYTQYHDIEKEMNAYLDYDENVFRDKTILLPCDDPEWSNFTKYFAQNFERLGLKKLISTSYAPDSKPQELNLQLALFEIQHPKFDKVKARVLVLPCSQDRLLGLENTKESANGIKGAKCVEVDSNKGHLAWRPLLRSTETNEITQAVKQFLN